MTEMVIRRPASAAVLSSEERANFATLVESVLVERMQFADRTGTTFNGTRNVDRALGYKSKLTPKDYRLRYERGGIAERIVEFYPGATWSATAKLVENPDPAITTPFEKAVEEIFQRLDLWARLLRADILAGLGRYSALLLGAMTPGGLETELPRGGSPESLIYVQPLSEEVCSVFSLVDQHDDPRFGLPEFYQVKLAAQLVAGRNVSIDRKVHWTRILHVAEGVLLDDIYGKPRLRACWNDLDNLVKITGGGAEAAWNRMDPGMQFNMPEGFSFGNTPEEEEANKAAMKEQIADYRHGLKRDLTTKGMEINTLSTPVASFGPNASAILDLISGATGIPQRVLLGSELGELASSQDRNNANDRTARRQREFATPLLMALVDRLVTYFGVPKPAQLEVVWPKSDELTEVETIEAADKMASTNQKQVLAGLPPVYTTDEIRSFRGLDPLADVDPELADPQVDPNADPAAPQDAPPPATAAISASADGESEPEWRAVHRAADAHVETFAQAVRGAWTDGADEIDPLVLEAALHNRDLERAEQIVTEALRATETSFAAALSGRILLTLNDGGEAGLRAARGRGSWFRTNAAPRALRFEASFDTANPRAISFADLRAAALVTEIGAETLAALRDLIGRGIREGIPPRKLAQKVRESVGLRTDQLEAIDALVDQLSAARPGALIERFPAREGVRTSAGFKVRVPKTGATPEWIAAQANRYRKMQWNYRARMIARTETMRAANEGQRELWRQAQDKGSIPKDQMRLWIDTGDERERQSHRAMHGQVTGIDQPFRPAIEPGEEVHCRCAQGLATPEDLARAAA